MALQRVLLRVMLLLLAVAAAAGVLTILSNAHVSGRVALTALVAAVAVALSLRTTRKLDDDKLRVGGVVILGAIVLGFVLALAAVWIDILGMGWDVRWRLWASAGITTVGGIIAGEIIARASSRGVFWSVVVAVVSDAVASVFFLISVWDLASERLALSGASLVASGLFASVALLGVGEERRHWRWAGVLASVASLAIATFSIWYAPLDPSNYVLSAAIAFATAHAIAVLRVPMGEHRSLVLLAAIGSTVVSCALVTLMSIVSPGGNNPNHDALMRLTGASGIVSACSTLAVAVMYRLNRKVVVNSPSVAAIAGVDVVCPLCGKRARRPTGESPCEGCGLLITIAVREPRCVSCDYLLLNLPGASKGVCPECGTKIGSTPAPG